MGALLALASSVMWGSADFIGGVSSRRIAPLAVYGFSQCAGAVALVVMATIAGAWGASLAYWPWAIAASLVGVAGMLAFYRALAIGPMGIVSPLVALSVLVPVAFALIMRNEVPTSVQILGMIIAIGGILMASGPELVSAQSARPIVLGGLSAVAFGLFYIVVAEGSRTSPVMTMVGMRCTTLLLLAPVLLFLRSSGGARWSDAPKLALLGVLDAVANVMFGYASTQGMLSTTSVLGSLYPVVTAILAAVFLRERLRAVQYVGVSAAIAGIALISW
jgi:drug/metabolite transporter (DMT)-like permease